MTKPCGHEENEFCGFECYGLQPIEWKYIGEWIKPDGRLHSSYPFVSLDKSVSGNFMDITLDGDFTDDQIIELGEYLKLKQQQELLEK